MMKTKLLLSFLMIVLLVGCGEQAPPPAEKAPEPEKTPEEIVGMIKKDLAPLEAAFGGPLNDAVAQEIVTKVRSAKAAHQATENGKIALERIAGEFDGVIRRAKEEKRWRLVICCIDAYEVLQPGTKYQRLRQTADLQLKKPRVKLKGFFRDEASNNQLYAFVQIMDPVAGVTHQEQMREGEEKHGLRFTRIIGNQQGVEFEYLAIPGDLFQVMK